VYEKFFAPLFYKKAGRRRQHKSRSKNVRKITFSEPVLDILIFSAYIIFIMKRNIYKELLDWKQSELRKPLVLRGARQVGKTYILKEFARNEYKNYIHLDFEDDPALDKIFARRFDKEKIINSLSIYGGGIKISPGSTLLIFDEVQASQNALNSLKYFRENANEYHIVSAGSLLGIKLAGKKSFPVGQVTFFDLYPLTFLEYLDALDKTPLRQLIEEAGKDFESFPEPFHVELIELLKYYYFTGGMPEAVATYCKTGSFDNTRKIQKDIIDAYLLDFAKHADKSEVMKITAIWQSIPVHLSKENKKFIFSVVRQGARGREYEEALQWLVDAGLIYKSYNISAPRLPLKAYIGANIFKVFLLDIGLLGAMANLSPGSLIDGNSIFTHFYGALVENYAAQQLQAKFSDTLFYWTSPGKAEVDFIFSFNERVYPLEAKAGFNPQSKSLRVYREKYKPEVISRVNLLNLEKSGNMCNYPLYAISLFPLPF
jgi:predicted AAA+ superfamily ATPase